MTVMGILLPVDLLAFVSASVPDRVQAFIAPCENGEIQSTHIRLTELVVGCDLHYSFQYRDFVNLL